MTTFEELVAVLVDGTRPEVVSVLLGLTDKERAAYGSKCRGWMTQGSTLRIDNARQALAVLATAGGHRQALVAHVHGWSLDEPAIDDAVEILAARAPAWLPDFVEGILDAEGRQGWSLARGLVRRGLVPRPENPEYLRGMVWGFSDWGPDGRLVVEQIEADPGFVMRDLLDMLATEGVGRLLAYHDGFRERSYEHMKDHVPSPDGTWRVALLTLTADGRLDRARVLDAVLAAPLRDWVAADLGWYAGMHEALAPTAAEVMDRQATYARMLTVEHGPSVRYAQREVQRLLGLPEFHPEPVLAASRATLGRPDKTSVLAHLRLLAKLAAAYPELPVAEVVRTAADHSHADVREKAAALLVRLGGPAPSAAPAAAFAPPAPEPRPMPGPVEPVADPDELAEVLLGLLEELDPLELERAVDGLLRFADRTPATADLLLSRAEQIELYSDDPRGAAHTLARAWLTPRRRFRPLEWPIVLGHTVFPVEAASAETFIGALGRRLTEVAQAIHRGPHASLALPSGGDGSLGVDDLNGRLSRVRRGDDVLEWDFVVALLRVPHAQRSEVKAPSALGRSKAVDRLLSSGRPAWTREVLVDRRWEWQEERRLPLFRDPSAREGSLLDGVLSRRQPERTAARESGYGEYEPRFEQTLAFGALMLPHDADVLAAHAHPYLQRDLHKERAACVGVLDALARARTPNRDPESSALVLGLAAKDARARTAAQDALIDLARQGLLDGAALGRQAAALLADDIVTGSRVSTGLTEVARASDAAVLPVLDCLAELLPALPGRRDAGVFLGLAADLAARAVRRLQLPKAFRELAAGKSSSAAAKAARRLAQ